MPDYTQTEVLKTISKATGNFQEAEMRELKRGALSIFRGNEPEVFANAKMLKKAQSQPTKAILFQRDYQASGATADISATHEDTDLGGSMEKDITFNGVSQEFWISHKMTDRNQFTYQEIFDNKLRNALLNLYRDENQDIIDWLALNKTQVTNGDGLMTWNGTDYVYENSNAQAERDSLGENIQAVMRANGYDGAYDIVSDQKLHKALTMLGYNGSGNANNTAAQLSGLTSIEDVRLANASYGGFGYAFLKGMVGMTSWIPRLNREGAGGIGENGGLYATMIDPVYGTPLAVHVYRKGADTHASGGERQDIVDYYQIFRFNAIGGAYLSTANESAILAMGQLTS